MAKTIETTEQYINRKRKELVDWQTAKEQKKASSTGNVAAYIITALLFLGLITLVVGLSFVRYPTAILATVIGAFSNPATWLFAIGLLLLTCR